MATDCQTSVQSGGGERQHLRVIISFEGKKEDGQFYTENLIRVVTKCKICFFSLYIL